MASEQEINDYWRQVLESKERGVSRLLKMSLPTNITCKRKKWDYYFVIEPFKTPVARLIDTPADVRGRFYKLQIKKYFGWKTINANSSVSEASNHLVKWMKHAIGENPDRLTPAQKS